jgi:cell wall-associated NlpC family hydrolase
MHAGIPLRCRWSHVTLVAAVAAMSCGKAVPANDANTATPPAAAGVSLPPPAPAPPSPPAVAPAPSSVAAPAPAPAIGTAALLAPVTPAESAPTPDVLPQTPAADATVPDDTPVPSSSTEPTIEDRLRAAVRLWRNVPYQEDGTTRRGIGNAAFVRAIFQDALASSVPGRYDDLIRTGKLVDRKALAPGDVVFFESGAFGLFKSKTAGIYLGRNDVALARKDEGVRVVKLSDAKLNASYKTARRISAGDNTAPTFDVTKYGSDRASLLRDIAKAWSGTLYRANGTTFAGIGNDEFVREVYGAIYETDLEGDPKTWATMGQAVAKEKLEPGDIILYEADVVGPFVKQRHAGIYLGDGEFVAAVKGSAVSILKLNDARWRSVYKGARRIDPDALARAEEARETRSAGRATSARNGNAPTALSNRTPGVGTAAEPPAGTARVLSDSERRLRDVTEEWRGTPYKLGGTSRSGIDCSAFSRVLYENVYQMELPRTAEEQEQLGAAVNRDGLQPGDLIFFRTQGMGPLFKSRHVGVYLGGGEFAQASGRRGVTISRLDNRYWSKKYHAARRIQKIAA